MRHLTLALLSLPCAGLLTTALQTDAAAPVAPAPSAAPAPAVDDDGDPRDLIGQAEVGLLDAIEKALGARSGKAVEAELEAEGDAGQRRLIWSVDVVHEGALFDVEVDARSGEVLGTEQEDDAGELRNYREALRHSELDLATLVGRAMQVVHGHPAAAILEFDDGGPECEVLVVNGGRYLIEVEVEGRAGHLLELELASGHEEESDDDDEHEHEHEDDEEDDDDGEDDDDDGEDDHR